MKLYFNSIFKCFSHFDENDFYNSILLRKVYAYGIRGAVLKCLESYLTDRTQYVVLTLQIQISIMLSVVFPKVFILGPLLFILYMNDICSVSKLLFTLLYEDDTCVLFSGIDLNNLVAVLNVELIYLSAWLFECLVANKLSLNTQKTFSWFSTELD